MNKQIRIGSIIGYINMVISAVIAIVYIPLLTKGIGSSEYGVYQLIGSLVAYFTTTYTSLNASVLKNYAETLHKNEYEQENVLAISRKIFRIISLLIIAISIPVILFFFHSYSNALTEHELNECLIIYVILICNILIYLNNNIYSAAIQAHQKFIFRKCLDLISQCLQPIAVIAFIKEFPYALTIVLIQMSMNVFVSILNYFYAKYKLKVRIKYHYYDKFLVKQIIFLSISVLGVALADQIFWKVDQLVLGKLYGTRTVSSYSIATQINAMYINIGTVLGGMILPIIVSIIHSGDFHLLEHRFKQLGRYQSYILSFVLFGIILYSDELMKILYKDYENDMYIVLILLAIPYSIDLIQNAGNAILQAKNLYGLRAKIMLTAAVLNIALTIFLSKQYGMIGAATATAITIIITSGFLMNLIYIKYIHIDIVAFAKSVLKIWIKLCPSLIIGIIAKKITIINSPILTFIIHGLIFSIVHIGLLLTIGMQNDDKSVFIKKLKGKIISA